MTLLGSAYKGCRGMWWDSKDLASRHESVSHRGRTSVKLEEKWDFKLFKATYRVTGRFTYSEILYGEPLKCCPATEHDIKSSQGSDK